MDGALLCKVNRRELNRYPWLQQEKIPSTEPDHRGKQNQLTNWYLAVGACQECPKTSDHENAV